MPRERRASGGENVTHANGHRQNAGQLWTIEEEYRAVTSSRGMPLRPALVVPRPAIAPGAHVQDVTTSEGFASLRLAWDALFDRAETASPFNSWTWLWAWWSVFRHGKELHLFVVRDDDDRVIGIAPFYALTWRLGPVSLRTLLPMGHGNDLTERQDLLVAAGRRSDCLRYLAAYLDRERGRLWDVVLWKGITPDDLPPALRRLASSTWTVPYEVRDLPATCSAFERGLGPHMRANLRNYTNRLRRDGYDAQVTFAATAEELGPALNEFLRLHRARAQWTGGPHHGNRFDTTRHRQFLEYVAPALAGDGRMRVALLAVAGRTVAAQLTLEHDRTLYLYYSGFEPAWRRYSVGMLLTAACLRDAIERGLNRLDFLQGTGQWKQRWATTSAEVECMMLIRDAAHVRAARAAYRRLFSLLYDAAGHPILPPRHGLAIEHRALRWLAILLRQPLIG